jgi:integral membrane protein
MDHRLKTPSAKKPGLPHVLFRVFFKYLCHTRPEILFCRAFKSALFMNHSQSKVTLHRFRIIAVLEGISFLVLLFVAMPLKYLAAQPGPVKYVGWAHGVLFVLFCVALLQVWYVRRWSFLQVAGAFMASLLPFGTFVLDRRVRREEEEVGY